MSDLRRLEADALRGDAAAVAAFTRTALRSGDRAALATAVELLEEAWAASPDAAVADALEALAPALESPAAIALREYPKKKIPSADWERVASDGHSVDRGALAATARRGSMAAIRERVATMLAWPADPRVSRAVARWLLDLPFRATSSQPVWLQIFELIERAADTHLIAELEPVWASDWEWPCGATMAAWFEAQTPELRARLEAASPPPSTGPMSEMATLAEAGELDRIGDTASDARGLARTGLADAIARLPSPQAWTDVLHHLDVLRDEPDIDALVAEVEGALDGMPDARRTPPPDWWRGLHESDATAHPALRLCRSIDLGDVPSKISATRVARILARPELEHVTALHVMHRHLGRRVADAILELDALEDLTLQPIGLDTQLPKLVAVPELSARLTALRITSETGFSKRRPRAEDLQALADAGGLDGLRSLSLEGDEGHMAAVASAAPSYLRELDLVAREDAGVAALVRSLPALRSLHVRGQREVRGVAARHFDVLADEGAPDLTAFHFHTIEDDYLDALDAFVARHAATLTEVACDSPRPELVSALARLEAVRELTVDRVLDQSVVALRGLEPRWHALERLELTNVQELQQVAESLLTNAELPRLRRLVLWPWWRGFTIEAIVPVIAGLERPLQHLRVHIGRRGESCLHEIEALVESHHAASLRQLAVGFIQRHDVAALQRLLHAPWPSMVDLDLGGTVFDDAMVDALLAGDAIQRRTRSDRLRLYIGRTSVPRARRAEVTAAFGVGLVMRGRRR